MEPKTIYLKDYTPSPFTIDQIHLVVDIHESRTKVISTLKVMKRPELKGEKINLELSGENMKLLDIKLNEKTLPTESYQVSSDKLVVLNVSQDEFILETTVEIDPATNKALEGFYQSGSQFCTQCEPEGFRKITYFIDRPDVMAKYKTKMIGDKKKFPFLLSNGNKIGEGDLPEGRHWVEWEDPFRKPSYLFAMVAGDFDVAHDSFITMSGRKVALEVYVDKGNLHKTPHALLSLKKAMKWDEDTFGLEYDLDVYMIVAVDSFNMGAMENKGLNIFNSTYTLADETSATDTDFQNIEGVIGHEYFHNWTGNRVTCRDWFQLTLKEGLTVYRDQEFSADMLSRAVKRLEDVRGLKNNQFTEDAGPLAHPIRPSKFVEINNFYTQTIYEKGAEVIRMIETLIGKEKFRKGMDKYFELNDGKAVTTEDFIHAMETASGKELTQFKNWYSRAGTPTIKVDARREGEELVLNISQSYPLTAWKVPDENVLQMPFKIGFLEGKSQREVMLELTKMNETFRFKMKEMPILSLNRGFSAPVHVDYKYDFSELLHLMAFDEDPYCRYEATQKVYDTIYKEEFANFKATGELKDGLREDFKSALNKLLNEDKIDLSFKSYLLDLPTENGLSQEMEKPDFDAIHKVHTHLKHKIGVEFKDWFLKTHNSLSTQAKFELTPEAFGQRALKNQCLSYLVASGTQEGMDVLEKHYGNASNMTEEIQGLTQYVASGADLDHPAVKSFYSKWRKDSLVMLKWFGSIAANSPAKNAVSRLEKLENDPLFDKDIPNHLRALYLQFSKNNLAAFHAVDGSGYRFLAERIKKIDKYNPQVASRAATSFSMINKLDEVRQAEMKKALKGIMDTNPSRDTYEVVSKYLAQ
jgi:aminopeptidase N